MEMSLKKICFFLTFPETRMKKNVYQKCVKLSCESFWATNFWSNMDGFNSINYFLGWHFVENCAKPRAQNGFFQFCKAKKKLFFHVFFFFCIGTPSVVFSVGARLPAQK